MPTAAIQWTGTQGKPEEVFFLVVDSREDGSLWDEWSEETADEFHNEASAKLCAQRLRLTSDKWKAVPYPKALTPEGKPKRLEPRTYGSYRTKS